MKWSADVKLHWHPPAGLFEQPARVIADSLIDQSPSYKTAMSRLNFYINRAGKNFTAADKRKFALVKSYLMIAGRSRRGFGRERLAE